MTNSTTGANGWFPNEIVFEQNDDTGAGMSGYIINSNVYIGSEITKLEMVAAQNCFGFSNFTYGGMLGLGQNT